MKTSSSDISSDKDSGPEFLNRQRAVRFTVARLRGFARQLADEVAGGRPFTICVVSDAAMRRFNRRFRGLNRATDVLSFEDGVDGRAGDLLVSAETARRQARRLGHSLDEELEILALHGLLHLLGYDHQRRAEAQRMARAEQRWRRHFRLPAGLIERAEKVQRSKGPRSPSWP